MRRFIASAFALALAVLPAFAQATFPPGIAPNGAADSTTVLGRNLSANHADMANALDKVYAGGADPTNGTLVADSAPAINAAAAVTVNGAIRNVYLPAGTYKVKTPITIGSATQSQCLVGDGWGTIIHVSVDFSSSATGVVNLAGGNQANIQPCIRNVHFIFDMPPDLKTTTTAASAANATTITVASVTGISVGMIVADATQTAAIPNVLNNEGRAVPVVQSISGNVITLNVPVHSPGVGSGDTIDFAMPRASFTTLSTGCSLTAGAPGCKYPWAINTGATGQSQEISDILIEGAWDGIYERGSQFHLGGKVYIGALDIGLDFDNSYNWSEIDDIQFWNYGFSNNIPNPSYAFNNVLYDGATIAANMGRSDGIHITSIQDWMGVINVTSKWTDGSAEFMHLEGNTVINISATAAAGFLNVAALYCGKGAQTFGPCLNMSPSSAKFAVNVTNWYGPVSSAYSSIIYLANGLLSISNGYTQNAMQTSSIPVITVAGGALRLANMRLDSNSGQTNPYIAVSGGGTVNLASGVDFLTAPTAAATGLSIVNDNALNNISDDVVWNGWANPLYPRVALTTSGYTIPAITHALRLTQAGTIASATLTLPTAVRDNQPITIDNGAGAAVTALTFSPAVAGFTNGSTLAANSVVKIVYDTTAAAWHRVQ